jgi:SOS-response transcriptional repressor LexA
MAADEVWRHARIVLSPTNPEYQPIILQASNEEQIKVVGEYVTVLRGAG